MATALGRWQQEEYKKKNNNLLWDDSFLGDPERDELHLEMWNYFRWLHAKLVERAGKTVPAGIPFSLAGGDVHRPHTKVGGIRQSC